MDKLGNINSLDPRFWMINQNHSTGGINSVYVIIIFTNDSPSSWPSSYWITFGEQNGDSLLLCQWPMQHTSKYKIMVTTSCLLREKAHLETLCGRISYWKRRTKWQREIHVRSMTMYTNKYIKVPNRKHDK
jgi:hypothetical protein